MKNVVIKSLCLLMLLGNVLSPAATRPIKYYNWDHIVMAFTERTCSAESLASVYAAFKDQLTEMCDNDFNFNEPGIVQKAIISNQYNNLPVPFIEALLEMDVDVVSESFVVVNIPGLNQEWLTPSQVVQRILATQEISDRSAWPASLLAKIDREKTKLQAIAILLSHRIAAPASRAWSITY